MSARCNLSKEALALPLDSAAISMTLNVTSYTIQPAQFHPYDPLVAELADLLLLEFRNELPHVVIEHVGSTAVPNLPGKGVLDLMILYRSKDELESINSSLFGSGFRRQTTRDPFPEDRPMRVGTLSMHERNFRVHIHIIPAESNEVWELRAFRDALIADSSLRESYSALKVSIIEAGTKDSVEYAHRKSDFMRDVLKTLRERKDE